MHKYFVYLVAHSPYFAWLALFMLYSTSGNACGRCSFPLYCLDVKWALTHVYMFRCGNSVFIVSIKCICSDVVLFQCIVVLLSDHMFIAGICHWILQVKRSKIQQPRESGEIRRCVK